MNVRITEPTVFLPLTLSLRARIETTIEQLVALLDEIDGDPEAEPSFGGRYDPRYGDEAENDDTAEDDGTAENGDEDPYADYDEPEWVPF